MTQPRTLPPFVTAGITFRTIAAGHYVNDETGVEIVRTGKAAWIMFEPRLSLTSQGDNRLPRAWEATRRAIAEFAVREVESMRERIADDFDAATHEQAERDNAPVHHLNPYAGPRISCGITGPVRVERFANDAACAAADYAVLVDRAHDEALDDDCEYRGEPDTYMLNVNDAHAEALCADSLDYRGESINFVVDVNTARTMAVWEDEGRNLAATVPADTAVDLLVGEGFARADVVAAIDSLIDSGLSADQPDDGTVLTGLEIDIVRCQLRESGHPDGLVATVPVDTADPLDDDTCDVVSDSDDFPSHSGEVRPYRTDGESPFNAMICETHASIAPNLWHVAVNPVSVEDDHAEALFLDGALTALTTPTATVAPGHTVIMGGTEADYAAAAVDRDRLIAEFTAGDIVLINDGGIGTGERWRIIEVVKDAPTPYAEMVDFGNGETWAPLGLLAHAPAIVDIPEGDPPTGGNPEYRVPDHVLATDAALTESDRESREKDLIGLVERYTTRRAEALERYALRHAMLRKARAELCEVSTNAAYPPKTRAMRTAQLAPRVPRLLNGLADIRGAVAMYTTLRAEALAELDHLRDSASVS